MICVRVNQKVHVACNFNFLLENEGLLKVTAGTVQLTSTRLAAQ